MARLILAEFRKLSTTGLWLWLLLAAVAITALYASLTIAFAGDPDTLTLPMSTIEGQRTLLATGASAAAPLAAVLGAIGLTVEYRHRTATTTFLATPQRGRVVGAKLVTYTLVAAGYGLVCLATVLALAIPWLASQGIDLVLTHSGAPGALAGVVTATALFGLLGVALGALIRDQVVAVVSLLVYLFVLEPIATNFVALGTWTAYLPGAARSALTQTVLTNRDFLAPWQGGAVLAAYGTALVLVGTRFTVRRDIT